MRRLRNQIALALGLFAAWGVVAVTAQQAGGAGSFTAAQVVAGRAAYQESCASCHMANLQGNGDAPPLAGIGFVSSWGDRKASDLVAFIQSTMPPGAAGSLGAAVYVRAAALHLAIERRAGRESGSHGEVQCDDPVGRNRRGSCCGGCCCTADQARKQGPAVPRGHHACGRSEECMFQSPTRCCAIRIRRTGS